MVGVGPVVPGAWAVVGAFHHDCAGASTICVWPGGGDCPLVSGLSSKGLMLDCLGKREGGRESMWCAHPSGCARR